MFWYIVLFLVICFYFISSYNSLQRFAQEIKAGNSNIIAVEQRRVDMINKLIETVKVYSQHEKLVYLKVSDNFKDMAMKSNAAMANVQNLAQAFPQIKADSEYNNLMNSIQGVEKELQVKREAYNTAAKTYNGNIKCIPVVFYAKALGFTEAPYYDVDNKTEIKAFETDDGEMLKDLLKKGGEKAGNLAIKAKNEINKNINEFQKTDSNKTEPPTNTNEHKE